MNVTVYGRPGCIQCTYTRKWMDKLGVDYAYVDIDGDTEADILERGEFTALPIVLVDHPQYTDHWQGFKLDKIRSISAFRHA